MTGIRLNSTIQLDENTEKDIIELLSSLNSSHRTGQFVGTLLRLAVDNPDILKRTGDGRYVTGELYNSLGTAGISKNRAEFLTGIYKEVNDLKDKVDEIYKMTLEMKTLAQFGKQIGLEDRSQNSMRAGFLLEKQLNDFRHKIGAEFSTENKAYLSNKLNAADLVVDDVMEYIINTYGGIVEEIKSAMTVPVQVQTIQVPVQTTQQTDATVQNETVNEIPSEKTDTDNSVEKVKDSQSTSMSVFDGDDEVIDFGSMPSDDDIDALQNFFGTGG